MFLSRLPQLLLLRSHASPWSPPLPCVVICFVSVLVQMLSPGDGLLHVHAQCKGNTLTHSLELSISRFVDGDCSLAPLDAPEVAKELELSVRKEIVFKVSQARRWRG
jgi:hypothetical protein